MTELNYTLYLRHLHCGPEKKTLTSRSTTMPA